jgi:hypothetical protein
MKEQLVNIKDKSILALAIVGILSIALTVFRLITSRRAKYSVELESENSDVSE